MPGLTCETRPTIRWAMTVTHRAFWWRTVWTGSASKAARKGTGAPEGKSKKVREYGRSTRKAKARRGRRRRAESPWGAVGLTKLGNAASIQVYNGQAVQCRREQCQRIARWFAPSRCMAKAGGERSWFVWVRVCGWACVNTYTCYYYITNVNLFFRN